MIIYQIQDLIMMIKINKMKISNKIKMVNNLMKIKKKIKKILIKKKKRKEKFK